MGHTVALDSNYCFSILNPWKHFFICIQYFACYFQFLFNWRLSGSHSHVRPVRLVVLSDGDIFVSPTELSWKLDMARTSKPRNRMISLIIVIAVKPLAGA